MEHQMAEAFVLDRASILERLGDDEDIYSMMVDMYLDDVGNNCAALVAAFESGDAAVLQREAHTIKGLLATFSDDAGAADAMHLEAQAKQGNIDGLAELVASLQQRLRDVASALSVR